MFGGSKKNTHAIGVDLSGAGLAVAQLANGKQETVLVAGSRLSRPKDIRPGSPQWQRWAIDALGKATADKSFHGRNVTGTLPAADVFIDHIKCPKPSKGSLEGAIFSKIKQRLPFNAVPQNTLIKYVPAEQDILMVLATERAIVERHLAIYERAGMKLGSLVAWPVALAHCYVRFFGKRTADVNEVVMLLDIRADCTDLVVCRHDHPLFARSIPIGGHGIKAGNALNRLVLELTGARQLFQSMYRNVPIERLVFLSGPTVEQSTCKTLASQLQIRAQLGDCYEAAAKQDGKTPPESTAEERGSWALAFGLSLS
jgi:Tfp pilus assembly PilM family ATPase